MEPLFLRPHGTFKLGMVRDIKLPTPQDKNAQGAIPLLLSLPALRKGMCSHSAASAASGSPTKQAIASFFWATSHWDFNACVLHRRQVRIAAGIVARECIAGVAASGNCARGIALARLPSLACNFCRCISGERYHCGQCRHIARRRERQHARSRVRCLAGESVRRRHNRLRSSARCF